MHASEVVFNYDSFFQFNASLCLSSFHLPFPLGSCFAAVHFHNIPVMVRSFCFLFFLPHFLTFVMTSLDGYEQPPFDAIFNY